MSEALPGVGEAYDASAGAWAGGPASAYERLADSLVAAAPVPMAGASVLDLGAGTGVAGRAARQRGAARVVGVDLSIAMLRAGPSAGKQPWAVVADAERLPFVAAAFDLVVAACSLGHLPDPGAALLEARRVAPALTASAFLGGWTHPAKAVVDGVAQRYGFVVPPWYERLKAEVEPHVDDPERLAGLATAAGFRRVDVSVRHVVAGVRTPDQLVGWRLGMAHLAPFVAGLDAAVADELRRRAAAALDGAPPLVIPLVVLAAVASR